MLKVVALIWIFVLSLAQVAGAQVAFSPSSLVQTVRGEGVTETIGAVALVAQNSGTIAAGSSIGIFYGGTITNSPNITNVTCNPTSVCPGSVVLSGNQFVLAYSSDTAIATGNSISVSGLRLNGTEFSSGWTVIATLSAASSKPITNSITFVNTLQVQIGRVVKPSITFSMPNATSISVTEAFSSAFTTTYQEAQSSITPPPTNGSLIQIIITGVPGGVTVTPVSTAGSSASLSFGPLPPAQVSNGLPMSFNFSFTGTDLAQIETAVFDFSTDGSPFSAQAILAPVTTSPFTIVRFCGGGPPSVTTQAASSVTRSGATLNATIYPSSSATTFAFFKWGTDVTLSTFNSTAVGSFGSGCTSRTLTASISGLRSGTTYYFQAVASNNDGTGTATGSILSFRTRIPTQVFETRSIPPFTTSPWEPAELGIGWATPQAPLTLTSIRPRRGRWGCRRQAEFCRPGKCSRDSGEDRGDN